MKLSIREHPLTHRFLHNFKIIWRLFLGHRFQKWPGHFVVLKHQIFRERAEKEDTVNMG